MSGSVQEDVDELRRRIALLGRLPSLLPIPPSLSPFLPLSSLPPPLPSSLPSSLPLSPPSPSLLPSSDGDKKAYSESSQWAIKQNKELISQLRAENKLIRSKLSQKIKVHTSCIATLLHSPCSPHRQMMMS